MGRYGRPKLPESERREASALHIRLNKEERRVVEEKASQAGVTPHEWARLAALERDPPKRQVIPEVNHEMWLKTAGLSATLNDTILGLRPGEKGASREALEAVRDELAAVRKLLLGVTT